MEILEEKKNPGRRFRETKEIKLSKEKLCEIFVKLICLKYQYSLVDLIENTYTDAFTCTCAYLDYIYIIWHQIIGTFQEDEEEKEEDKDGLPCSSIEDSQHRNQTVRSSFRALK